MKRVYKKKYHNGVILKVIIDEYQMDEWYKDAADLNSGYRGWDKEELNQEVCDAFMEEEKKYEEEHEVKIYPIDNSYIEMISIK